MAFFGRHAATSSSRPIKTCSRIGQRREGFWNDTKAKKNQGGLTSWAQSVAATGRESDPKYHNLPEHIPHRVWNRRLKLIGSPIHQPNRFEDPTAPLIKLVSTDFARSSSE
jgi:hypothetical protein